MEVRFHTKASLAALTTGADLCTIARASWLHVTSDSKNSAPFPEVQLFYYETAEGNAISGAGTRVAGNSVPVENVNPSFYPVATAGSECAAILSTSLAWADTNLMAGYEWSLLIDGGATPANSRYFVSGVLNSSQTLANDPFVKPTLITASCWDMPYIDGTMRRR